jgi:hypothetical protein
VQSQRPVADHHDPYPALEVQGLQLPGLVLAVRQPQCLQAVAHQPLDLLDLHLAQPLVAEAVDLRSPHAEERRTPARAASCRIAGICSLTAGATRQRAAAPFSDRPIRSSGNGVARAPGAPKMVPRPDASSTTSHEMLVATLATGEVTGRYAAE